LGHHKLFFSGSTTCRNRYPGTQHGFNNDTTPRYDAAAANLAWERTIAFFKANLGAQATASAARAATTLPN
jgi:hypothetical protein